MHASAGKAGGGQFVDFDETIGIGMGKKLTQKCVGQGVTSATSHILPYDRSTSQSQVTKSIQHLVAHGLIAVTQATRAQDICPVNHNCIFQRTTKSKAIGVHHVNIRLAAERTTVAELTHKAAICHDKRLVLNPNRLVLEINVEVDFHLVSGNQRRGCIATCDGNWLENFDYTGALMLTNQTGAQDGAHELGRASVQNRHFRTVNLDQGIVNTGTREGRHNVFNGRDCYTGVIHDAGAKRSLFNHIPAGGDHCITNQNIRPPEPDAIVGRCRVNRHVDRFTRMQACS